MQVRQWTIRNPDDRQRAMAELRSTDADVLLIFGSVMHFTPDGLPAELRAARPDAAVLGCSTAGEITADGVDEGTCTVTAIRFAATRLRQASTALAGMDDSLAAGERIGAQLAGADLRAVLVFGPGLQINGSALVDGIAAMVGPTIPISGGLAGDGGAFRETFTIGQSGIANDRVAAVGLYGNALQFTHGSFGGWEPFGPARRITRCAGNILYELDGEPALAIYRRYLGEHARDLPASGLLFPFAVLGGDHAELGVIRSILGIDEAAGSLTLAGDVRPDGYLRLMHASTDKLVGGAESAAHAALLPDDGNGDRLAVLVSCVGRKLVMGSRVDEEVEAVHDVFGQRCVLTGFYSYGEISPFAGTGSCKLHNQTMTVACLSER